MGNVLAISSQQDSFLQRGPLTNPLLLGAVLLTFALQMATIYVPFLNPIFHTVPFTLDQFGLCLLLSTAVFFAVELEKCIQRSGGLSKQKSAIPFRHFTNEVPA